MLYCTFVFTSLQAGVKYSNRVFSSRAASFGDPRRRKRLKTRGERSRRAASVESSRQSGRSNGKSQDSGIALMEESSHENSETSPKISQIHIQEESDQVLI